MVDKKPEKGFTKICYYELLEIDRKADAKTIKKVTKNSQYQLSVGILQAVAEMASGQEPRPRHDRTLLSYSGGSRVPLKRSRACVVRPAPRPNSARKRRRRLPGKRGSHELPHEEQATKVHGKRSV